MNILPLPAFTDNYIWLIEENGKATVVDPGDAKVVDSYLKENGLKLENILITHHHYDHTGGVEQLKESYECNVFGPYDSPCLLYTSPSPRDKRQSRMPSSA